MASCEPLYDSIRKAKVVKVCQLCENDPNIKWKCLECALMMCQKCTDKIHKIFSARDHTIIALKDIGEHHMEFEPTSEPDLTRINCVVHSGQNYCLYCKNCQKLVCQTCIFKSHMMHEFDEIFEEYRIRFEKIKNRQESIQKDIRTLTKSKQFLKQQKMTRRSYQDKIKQEILEDEKALFAEIKKNTVKLFNQLDLKWKTFSKSIDENDDELGKKLTKSREQLETICHLFQPTNAKDVFTTYYSLFVSEDENISLESLTFDEVAHFKCGEKTKLKEVFGTLEDGTTPYITDLQIEKKFETELKCVGRIACCSDNCLWICVGGIASNSDVCPAWIWDLYSRKVQKIKLSGDNPIVSKRIYCKIKVYDAALLPPNELLMSVKGSSTLKLIPSGSTDLMDSVYTVSPFKQPVGVHVTSDNRIIVGVRSYERNGEIIVMDQAGNPMKLCERTKYLHYRRLTNSDFDTEYYTFNISSNSKSMIAAVVSRSTSSMNSCKSRVVILDKAGEWKEEEYTGHGEVNNEDNPFSPTGITATPSDNFVVADMANHTLHVLNSEGEFLTLFNTKKAGILLPCSLSFSTTGQLYIGCGTFKYSHDNAKIIEVNSFFH